ncbi:esterase-5B-like [Stomoxys calcitrans]|uniref:esterase-5B-like n=1 Tax=Stomoxys calcitrans TaxID=35570 RepID=UPI0027E2CD4B|nr:esterase-5B-like [Stomoxys calcitrans]
MQAAGVSQLRGKDNGLYYSYESIPYAEAPLGNLRFEAPQPYSQKWDHVFDASISPNPCMQWDQFIEGEDKVGGVEDCLTVNIYKPKTGKTNYPVMVYIHGGCFMFGDIRLYQPEYLMENGNIILVKVVYRLGPLGFLSAEDEHISGNFGLKDQQLALKWVHANIAKFGGDPKKIMLTGFSAGGASTHLHVLHPSTKDMVKTAVSFSGVSLNPWVMIKNARANTLEMAEILKCPNTRDTQEIKECLQQKPAKEIVASVKYFQNFGYNPFTTFGPVVEHKNAPQAFLTQHPRDIIQAGTYSHIPYLASYTAEDGGYNAVELLQVNPQTGKEYIHLLNDDWEELASKNLFLRNIKDQPQGYAKALREKYLGDREFSVENFLKVQEMYTDVLFRDGVLETLKLHSQHSKAPVYGYVYDNPADQCIGHYMTSRKDVEFALHSTRIIIYSLICHNVLTSVTL